VSSLCRCVVAVSLCCRCVVVLSLCRCAVAVSLCCRSVVVVGLSLFCCAVCRFVVVVVVLGESRSDQSSAPSVGGITCTLLLRIFVLTFLLQFTADKTAGYAVTLAFAALSPGQCFPLRSELLSRCCVGLVPSASKARMLCHRAR